MSDGHPALAEPISMQDALAQANSQIDNLAKGAATEEPSQEAEQPAEELETVETEAAAEVETDQTDETDDPATEGEEPDQILTADEYGDVLVDLNGEPTPLAEVIRGTLRQADYSRKTAAHAEQVKADNAELEERAKRLDAREQQLQALEAELEETEPDWVKLAEDDPLGYPAAKAKWDKEQAAKAARRQEVEAKQAAQRQQFVQQTAAQAVEVFPEWADVKKFDAGAEQRKQTALAMGFSAEEYASTPDFRIAALLEKAARYDAMMADTSTKRALAEKKIAKAPKVIKPGASKGDTNPQQERRAAFKKRLSKPISSAELAKGLGLR